jgi:micrococcal nuclease
MNFNFWLIVLLSVIKKSSCAFVKPILTRDWTDHKATIFALVGVSMATASYFFSFGSIAFDTAKDIPASYFKDNKEIKAVVVKVTDGDTVRVRHITKGRKSADFTGSLKENTIAVRIAAVDTPEIAKFGNNGQKFGEEAKEFTTFKLLGKKVTIKLLSLDRYGRVIGRILYRENSVLPKFLTSKKDISEELLQHGLASVYRQGGAQYDGPVEKWNAIEKQAISRRRGMWVNGQATAELPSEFKKSTRLQQKVRV